MNSFKLLLIFVLMPFLLAASEKGQQLFTQNCAACHKMGMRLVGPDLTGILEKRDKDWLMSFIKSSQTMVKSGDELAVQVFNEFNQIPMPDTNLPEEEIEEVLAYIGSFSATKAETPSSLPVEAAIVHVSDTGKIFIAAVVFAMLLLITIVAVLGYSVRMLARANNANKNT